MVFSSGLSLHCPRQEDPEKTECCVIEGQPACCLVEARDQSLVMVIALSVIVTCFAMIILIIVCCFCPKCLLYDACRAKYTRGEIITYTKEEEMVLNSTMPYEDQTEKSSYSTQAIKIKPIADVWWQTIANVNQDWLCSLSSLLCYPYLFFSPFFSHWSLIFHYCICNFEYGESYFFVISQMHTWWFESRLQSNLSSLLFKDCVLNYPSLVNL